MIGRLNGSLASLDENLALVDVNGVGYDVTIPTRVAERLSIGQSIVLYTHTAFQQDEQTLYGFDSQEDRFVFRKLLGVTRLGPKIAAALLSELNGGQVAAAILAQNAPQLAGVKGVGKKMSESIVFSLRDDVVKWGLAEETESPTGGGVMPGGLKDLAVTALRQLGFQRTEAETAVAQAFSEGMELDELTRRALSLVGTSA